MRIALLLFIITSQLNAQLWVQLADFPGTKRDDGVAVAVNDYAYFGTGLQEWNATIDFYKLDLNTKIWSPISTMPHTTERQYACAFAGPNSFFVFGGDGQGGALTNLFKYDVLSDSWSQKTSKPGSGIIAAVCFSFGDKVVIAGGKYQNNLLSREVWEYTISTDTWLQKNNFPFTPVWRASGTSLDNFGYLLFGIDSLNNRKRDLYKYDPSTDTWSALSVFPLSQGRAYAAMHGLNSRLFVFAGQDTSGSYYKDSWYFNPANSTWLQGPDLPAIPRRGGMSCCWTRDVCYAAGLSPNGRLTETWMTDVPLGLEENKSAVAFKFFPNPCEDFLNIILPTFEAHNKINYEILSFDLKVNQSGYLNSESSSIDIQQLKSGLYLLKVYKATELLGLSKFVKN